MSEEHLALVTGASRGIGRGVAIALGKAGWTVYVTGRTVDEGETELPLPGSLRSTAQAIDEAGGRAFPLRCDHRDDAEVQQVVGQISREHARLDLLVNGVWGGYERFVADTPPNLGPFWEQPLELWDSMLQTGLRSAYVSTALCVPMMLDPPGGLIVCLSSVAARGYLTAVAYGVAHCGIDRMVADMTVELEGTPVTVVALHPGVVRTENVLRNAEYLDLSNSESPEFVGRAVLAIFEDNHRIVKSGQALVVAELAGEYGFTDVDGTVPSPFEGVPPA